MFGSDRQSEFNRCQKLIASDWRSGSDRRSLSLTLSLTLPDLSLTIFPSISGLVSGRRSEPIIILLIFRQGIIVCERTIFISFSSWYVVVTERVSAMESDAITRSLVKLCLVVVF